MSGHVLVCDIVPFYDCSIGMWYFLFFILLYNAHRRMFLSNNTEGVYISSFISSLFFSIKLVFVASPLSTQ